MLRFRPLSRSESRDKLGLSPEGKIILSPAVPSREEKSFGLAKEAFMVFAKSFPGAMMLVGSQIDDGLIHLYINASDVLLLTSEFEASPTIVKEALCCNVPVVSTAGGGIGGLFGNLRGCFICEPEPNQIASALSRACGLGAIDSRRHIEPVASDEDAVAEQIISICELLTEERVHENLGCPRWTQRLCLSPDRRQGRARRPGGEVKSHQES